MSPRPLFTRLLAAWTLAILICAPTLALQWPDEGGIGGTGYSNPIEEAGIGGTGLTPLPDEGGIGGTGIIAAHPDQGGIGGTGIIGVITGFGSIVVNGVHVDYPDDLAVDNLLGERGGVDQLAIGHVVEVEATATGERYLARRITQRHALIGTLTVWDAESGELRIGGQQVALDEAAKIADATRLESGQRVKVSGLWDGERLSATRIEPDHGSVDLLAGPTRFAEDDTVAIGGVQLLGTGPRDQVEAGRELVVTGRFDGSRMRADAVQTRPELPFNGRMRELLIEGYGNQLKHQRLAPNPPAAGRQVIRLQSEDKPGDYRIQEALPVQRLEQGAPDRPRTEAPPPAFNALPGETPRINGADGKQPPPPPQRPSMDMRPAFPERDFPNPAFPARPSMMPGPPRRGGPGGRRGR